MTLSYDAEASAFYVKVSQERSAWTKELVDSELLVDYDANGRFVGIEVLVLRHLSRVPRILEEHGILAPAHVRFDKLAEALAA